MWGVSENVPVVQGAECLQYINKPIGFYCRDDGSLNFYMYPERRPWYGNPNLKHDPDYSESILADDGRFHSFLQRWYHDQTKRKVGLILGSSNDGGIHIKILGQNELIHNTSNNLHLADAQTGDMFYLLQECLIGGRVHFKQHLLDTGWEWDTEDYYPNAIPEYSIHDYPSFMYGYSCVLNSAYDGVMHRIDYDQAQHFDPNHLTDSEGQPLHDGTAFTCHYTFTNGFSSVWRYAGEITQQSTDYYLTDNPDNTMEFGYIYDTVSGYPTWIYPVVIPTVLLENPLSLISGNLYRFMSDMNYYYNQMIPYNFPDTTSFTGFHSFAGGCTEITKVNLSSIPFNLILTTDYTAALRYLNDGTLPFDAKLYPLDWDNLPSYEEPSPEPPDPDDPEPDDTPDDTIVDPTPDDVVDVDPDVDPTTTVQNLCNYNLYWLQADQWSGFINWFWHDISAWSGFDDLINSIQGLYNDLGSAVIMCRYMPVNVSWIGGLGDDENIKLGMIEKTGNVNTISKRAVPIRRNLGEITINQIVSNNFLDFSPYSQMSLYLPLHGFVDLDMNIFQGHKNDYKKLIIQGIYDLLSGTLQYLIYVKPNGKDKALVNSFVVKIAQDIPLTLQTKNDRDSMIFGNVASTVGGLLGAGASIATGNPIGIAMGSMNAVNTLASAGSKSAPMSVKGTTGEMGGLYAPERPMIILRRAAVQPSDSYEDSDKRLDTWKSRVGRLSGYGQPMGSINGYVQLAQPRIKFTHNIPLQSEIDELYQILQQGFVCSTKS